MTNNNKVEWILYRKIHAACVSCKFPRHHGSCGSLPPLPKQDQIFTLNISCEYCLEELRSDDHFTRVSFPIKLTNEERMPVFDNKQMHPDDFEGLSDVESQIKSLPNIPEVHSPTPGDDFDQQLIDSVYIMSSSGQHLWKTVFGNVEKNAHFLGHLHNFYSHVFCHQMAYFLSAIDIKDKASFLGRGEMDWILRGLSVEDMYMLIPIIGLDRIKARIENHVDKIEMVALVRAFFCYVVKNQRELEQAGELDRVGEIACRFGMQYVHVRSHPSMFSLDGFCPLKRMKITPLNSSSILKLNSFSTFKLQPQNVRATAQLTHKIEVYSQNIEVSINIRNVRCHILSGISSDKEKYFPSRIKIRVMPCGKRIQSLTVGKSCNDAPRTLSIEEQREAGMEAGVNKVDLKAGVNFKAGVKVGSSATHTNWRFEMNDCSENSSAGYFQWTLFDNANGFEVWSADSRNYKQLMHRGSSLRKRGSHPSSPFTHEGGCVFSADLYGQPLTWSLDKSVEGTTSSWTVEMKVWLTYCYNVRRNDCFKTASWSFTESLELKL